MSHPERPERSIPTTVCLVLPASIEVVDEGQRFGLAQRYRNREGGEALDREESYSPARVGQGCRRIGLAMAAVAIMAGLAHAQPPQQTEMVAAGPCTWAIDEATEEVPVVLRYGDLTGEIRVVDEMTSPITAVYQWRVVLPSGDWTAGGANSPPDLVIAGLCLDMVRESPAPSSPSPDGYNQEAAIEALLDAMRDR